MSVLALALLLTQPLLSTEDSFDRVQAVVLRNYDLEGLAANDPRRASLKLQVLESEDGMLSVAAGSNAGFSTDLERRSIGVFQYRRLVRDGLETLPLLDDVQLETLAREFAGLLRVPAELSEVRRDLNGQRGVFRFRQTPVAGHHVENEGSLHLDRRGGILTLATCMWGFDTSSLLPPRFTAEQAAGIGLSEYQRAGMFTITQISDPILMAGRPMTTDEYRDRVSLDRLNQFKGDKPVAFWRVGFQESDGAKFAGTIHIVDIDTQTGEIVGQARMSQMGGGGEPPVITWSKIGKVGVVGDRGKATGTIEALAIQELPGGKPVAVQAGKMIYACRYDAKKNILWRRLPEGKYEPGRPAASLVKALKAQAK